MEAGKTTTAGALPPLSFAQCRVSAVQQKSSKDGGSSLSEWAAGRLRVETTSM
ncbi:hypothetical protein LB532_17340 [Mesorhizobium sp. ESP-6-2]|uniref:hypothetical protein n=1 Tax=Mesorhizobium sp. B2-2-2 TaxID=2589964 RepID=UPI0015E27975|nr:hypothetical protein [Mesorhizobium sp. B2-2-2]MBZ9809652.1 hypothetical protein [Mesorhizobium sp. ESP-6-2]